MSKYDIQREAFELSGVSVEESEAAAKLVPSLYERLGEDGFLQLSSLFYDRVFSDRENGWFLGIFSSSTKGEAVDNQYRFLVQTFGGPALYMEKKGKYTRLVGRHANYSIGTTAARKWVEHMDEALGEHPILRNDDDARGALKRYFRYTAHYIVAASQFMRPDQLSGGTQVDEGRIW